MPVQEIRRNNVQNNFNAALEHNPEAFAQVCLSSEILRMLRSARADLYALCQPESEQQARGGVRRLRGAGNHVGVFANWERSPLKRS